MLVTLAIHRRASVMNTAIENTEPLGFYTTQDASRIARIPENTLRDWRNKGVIVPSLEFTDEDGKSSWGYNYEALMLARLLRILRENHVGLRRGVATLRHCLARFGPPGPVWAEVKVFVFEGGEIFTYREDEWDSTLPVRAGQKAAEELFGEDFSLVKENADALLVPKQFLEWVQIDPDIRDGSPVVRGTRIRTQTLKGMIDANWPPLLIVDLAYPHLNEQQVRNAVEYERFLDG